MSTANNSIWFSSCLENIFCTNISSPYSPQYINAHFHFCFLKWRSEVAQSCPTLCDPRDCSLPGSSVHGIFQAIVLERIAISFSRASSRPRDRFCFLTLCLRQLWDLIMLILSPFWKSGWSCLYSTHVFCVKYTNKIIFSELHEAVTSSLKTFA